jgi:protein gp37
MRAKLRTFSRSCPLVGWGRYLWDPITGCLNGCSCCHARDLINQFPKEFPNGFEPTLHPERLLNPVNTKLPKQTNKGKRNVIVCSMGDLFGDWVPQDWIDQVIEACKKSPDWTYIFLTQNPKRLIGINWPVNAWVGAKINRQDLISSVLPLFKELNEHQFRPAVLFVSCNPMLERLNFGKHGLDIFDWVIVDAGDGEIGTKTCQPKKTWVESLHDSARKAGCMIYDMPFLDVKGLSINPKEFPNK